MYGNNLIASDQCCVQTVDTAAATSVVFRVSSCHPSTSADDVGEQWVVCLVLFVYCHRLHGINGMKWRQAIEDRRLRTVPLSVTAKHQQLILHGYFLTSIITIQSQHNATHSRIPTRYGFLIEFHVSMRNLQIHRKMNRSKRLEHETGPCFPSCVK